MAQQNAVPTQADTGIRRCGIELVTLKPQIQFGVFMNPHYPRFAALSVVLLLLCAVVTAVATLKTDGKGLFLQSQCNKCHTISGAGVAALQPRALEAPDLSGVGLKHTASWIEGFLQKKEELNGKKHLKKFSGPEADLQALAAWLASLKKPAN